MENFNQKIIHNNNDFMDELVLGGKVSNQKNIANEVKNFKNNPSQDFVFKNNFLHVNERNIFYENNKDVTENSNRPFNNFKNGNMKKSEEIFFCGNEDIVNVEKSNNNENQFVVKDNVPKYFSSSSKKVTENNLIFQELLNKSKELLNIQNKKFQEHEDDRKKLEIGVNPVNINEEQDFSLREKKIFKKDKDLHVDDMNMSFPKYFSPSSKQVINTKNNLNFNQTDFNELLNKYLKEDNDINVNKETNNNILNFNKKFQENIDNRENFNNIFNKKEKELTLREKQLLELSKNDIKLVSKSKTQNKKFHKDKHKDYEEFLNKPKETNENIFNIQNKKFQDHKFINDNREKVEIIDLDKKEQELVLREKQILEKEKEFQKKIIEKENANEILTSRLNLLQQKYQEQVNEKDKNLKLMKLQMNNKANKDINQKINEENEQKIFNLKKEINEKKSEVVKLEKKITNFSKVMKREKIKNKIYRRKRNRFYCYSLMFIVLSILILFFFPFKKSNESPKFENNEKINIEKIELLTTIEHQKNLIKDLNEYSLIKKN